MVVRYEYVSVRRTHVGLILVLLFVCLVVGFGFYRGWFSVAENRDALTDKVNVNLQVDQTKIKRDVHRATEKTEQKASALSEEIKQDVQDAKDRVSH